MRSRTAAGSALLHHLGQHVFGAAAPAGSAATAAAAAAAPKPLVLARLLSIASSEAKSDVAEVHAAKKKYAGLMSAKAEMAIISAAEARADVAEVYASKEEDCEWEAAAAAGSSAAAVQAKADVVNPQGLLVVAAKMAVWPMDIGGRWQLYHVDNRNPISARKVKLPPEKSDTNRSTAEGSLERKHGPVVATLRSLIRLGL